MLCPVASSRRHAYNTFSHHNSYFPLDTEATPTPHNKSINVWMGERLDVSYLKEQRLPITEAFEAESNRTNGTVYDYIREHLGYRLELSTATARISKANAAGADSVRAGVTISISNRGFAAPVNSRNWTLALLDQAGVAVWRCEAQATSDWRLLQPWVPGDPLRTPLIHTVALTAQCPGGAQSGKDYRLALALLDPLAREKGERDEDAAVHAVRFVNTRWVRGWNVLGPATIE
jgi:hypothetical protein